MKEFIDTKTYLYRKVAAEYRVVGTTSKNMYHRNLQTRFLFPENNPDFGQERLLREIPFLRDIDEYLKNPAFAALKTLYQLTDNFASIEREVERIDLISGLKEEIDVIEDSFARSIADPSPIRKFMEIQKFAMVKEFVFSRFLDRNPHAFGKVETLVKYKLYLSKSNIEALVRDFTLEDREKYKELIIGEYHALYSELPRENFRILADISLLQLEGKEDEALDLITSNGIGLSDFNPYDVINNAVVLNQAKVLNEIWITARASGKPNKYNSKIAEINVLQLFLRGNTEICKLCMSKEMWDTYADDAKLSILEIVRNRFSFEAKEDISNLIHKLDFFGAAITMERSSRIITADTLLESSIAYFKRVIRRYPYEDTIVGKLYLTPMDGTLTSSELREKADRKSIFVEDFGSDHSEQIESYRKSLVSAWENANYTAAIPILKRQAIESYLISEVRAISMNIALNVVASKRTYSEFINDPSYLTPLIKLISPYAVDNLSTTVLREYASSLTLEEKSLFKECMRTVYLNGLEGHAELLSKMFQGSKDLDGFSKREQDQYRFVGRELTTAATILTFLRYSSAFSFPKFTTHFIEQFLDIKIDDSDRSRIYMEFGDILLNTIARGDRETCKTFISPLLYNNSFDNVFRAQIVNTILTRSGRETRVGLMDYLAKNLLLVSDEVRQEVFKMADNRGEFTEIAGILDPYVEMSKTYCDRLRKMLVWKDKVPSENFPNEEGLISRQEKFLYLAFLHENKELYKTEGEFNRFLRANIEKVRENRCNATEMEEYFGFSVDVKVDSLIKAVDNVEQILVREQARDAKKKKGKSISFKGKLESKDIDEREEISLPRSLSKMNVHREIDRIEQRSTLDFPAVDIVSRSKDEKKAAAVENIELSSQRAASASATKVTEVAKANKKASSPPTIIAESLGRETENMVEEGWTAIVSKQKPRVPKTQVVEKEQYTKNGGSKNRGYHKGFAIKANQGSSNKGDTRGLTSEAAPRADVGIERGVGFRNRPDTESAQPDKSSFSTRREEQASTQMQTASVSVGKGESASKPNLAGVILPESFVSRDEIEFGSFRRETSVDEVVAAKDKIKDTVSFVSNEDARRSSSPASIGGLPIQISYFLNDTMYFSPLKFFMRAEYSGSSSVDVYKDIYGKFFIKKEADGVSSWNAFSLAEGETIPPGPGVPTQISEMKFTQQAYAAKAAVTQSVI